MKKPETPQETYARLKAQGKEPRTRTDYQREYKCIWRAKRKENGGDYS